MIYLLQIFLEVVVLVKALHLDKLPLFKDLSLGEAEIFVKETSSDVKNYKGGTRILKAYESNSKIGVIVKGEAQVVSEDRMGNEVIGHRLQRGAIIGSTSAILATDGNFASVDTLTEVTVLWIPYKSLIGVGVRLGRIHGVVMKNFLEAFCWKNILMMQKIELLSQKSLRERVILYLLNREKLQQSSNVQVPGRVQLAKELECNRSALTREIRRMQNEGILICDAKYMRLDKTKIV